MRAGGLKSGETTWVCGRSVSRNPSDPIGGVAFGYQTLGRNQVMNKHAKIFEQLLGKVHTRSVGVAIALLMIVCGIYMCVEGIREHGVIDLVIAFIEGHLETGSLGLLVMFLGVCIIALVLERVHPHTGEEISIKIDGVEICVKNLANGRMADLLDLISAASKAKES